MLTVDAISFGYRNRTVLKKISLAVHQGEILSIAGPNGTGKTTLLKCIAGIHRPDTGRIQINGQDAVEMHRAMYAKSVGYVPQSIPAKFPITVFEAVLMGRRPHMSWRPSQSDFGKTAQVIAAMSLGDIAHQDFDRLSGGQKQKVLVARAIAQDTPYLLLDEPTASLDLKHQLEVLEMISALVRKKQVGVIMAMHDLNLVSRFSHRVALMKKGQVTCSGSPSAVMTSGNIRDVYGVEARVCQNDGYPYILPTGTAG